MTGCRWDFANDRGKIRALKRAATILGFLGSIFALGWGAYLAFGAGMVFGVTMILPSPDGSGPEGRNLLMAAMTIVGAAAVALSFSVALLLGRGLRIATAVFMLTGPLVSGIAWGACRS